MYAAMSTIIYCPRVETLAMMKTCENSRDVKSSALLGDGRGGGRGRVCYARPSKGCLNHLERVNKDFRESRGIGAPAATVEAGRTEKRGQAYMDLYW